MNFLEVIFSTFFNLLRQKCKENIFDIFLTIFLQLKGFGFIFCPLQFTMQLILYGTESDTKLRFESVLILVSQVKPRTTSSSCSLYLRF